MSKKILSVVLALVFVLSTFAVSAFAGNTVYEDNADNKQIWALEETDNKDGTWTVAVKLTANYGVGAIQFQIHSSTPAGATLTKVEAGEVLVANEDYGADIRPNLETGVVLIVPNPVEDATPTLDLTAGGVIAKLTYTVTTGTTLSIKAEDAKNKEKPGGSLIAVRMSDGVLASGDFVYGQQVDVAEATAVLGTVAADPVLSGKDGGVVDTAKGYVYGVPAGDDANLYFTVENGSFEMSANENGVKNGTGAVLTVKNTAGEVAATYTLIIFGDVNGDGAVTGADSAEIKLVSLGKTIDGEANSFAADVNGDAAITGADSAEVKLVSLGKEGTVNPFAA